jgi:hypothetical protein
VGLWQRPRSALPLTRSGLRGFWALGSGGGWDECARGQGCDGAAGDSQAQGRETRRGAGGGRFQASLGVRSRCGEACTARKDCGMDARGWTEPQPGERAAAQTNGWLRQGGWDPRHRVDVKGGFLSPRTVINPLNTGYTGKIRPLDGRSPRRAHRARSGRAASTTTVARASQARGARNDLKAILKLCIWG